MYVIVEYTVTAKTSSNYLLPSLEDQIRFNLFYNQICGIGRVTERMLKAIGVTTCRDLYNERATLNLLFSPTSSHHFLRICLGIGSADVHSQM